MDSSTTSHTFLWDGHGHWLLRRMVFVSSLPLQRREDGSWAASRRFGFGERVVYKFVVDGQWVASPSAPKEWDAGGNENNVLIVPPLVIPHITKQHLLSLETQNREKEIESWKGVQIGRWTGEEVVLLGALLPSPQLTFRALRSLIPTLADVGESYRFATLAEEIVEEGHDGEKVVDEGVLVIVGAAPVLNIKLKSLPTCFKPPQPALEHPHTPQALDVSLPPPPSTTSTSSTSASSASASASDALALPVSSTSTSIPAASQIPRSSTRYFDFSSDSWGSASSVSGGSEYSFSDLAPDESRSRAASTSFPPGPSSHPHAHLPYEAETDDEADAKSDVTFNTALSGWVSDVGGEGGEGWSSSALGGPSSFEDDGVEEEQQAEEEEERVEATADGERKREKEGKGRAFDLERGAEDKAGEVQKGWEEGEWVFLPTTVTEGEVPLPPFTATYLPLALHPSALHFIVSILLSPSLSSSSLPPTTAAADVNLDVKADVDSSAFLPTPPASPSRHDLTLPATVPLSSTLQEEVERQRERGVARWVAVRRS